MVAETHSHQDRLDTDDVVALLAGHLDTDHPATLTLADCGFQDDIGLIELVELLAEEYGERCLIAIDSDDLDPGVTVAELIDLLTSRQPTQSAKRTPAGSPPKVNKRQPLVSRAGDRHGRS